jgi:large subunit ribosomal protein L24
VRVLKYRKTAGDRLTTKRHEGNVLRIKLRIRKGDTVRVMRGEDKGKEGKVLRVFPKTNRIVVEGINIVKRHRRARSAEDQGGIVKFEAPIAASNVMLLDPKSGAPTRVRYKIDKDGTKERVSAKSGDTIPRPSR